MIRWSSRAGAVVTLAGGLVGACTPAPAWAQAPAPSGTASAANLDGLTVSGKGVVGGKPNRLEIDLEVTATSEMSADVIVKYRDAKKRLQDAFTTLKMKNVTVEERALAVDQKGQTFNPYMMETPPARRSKVEVQLTRKLVVTCDNIREMDEEALLQLVAKLLDVAQDAGARIGSQAEVNPYFYGASPSSNGLVRFILDDFDPLRDRAYEAAVADARTRATRLAKLSGVELGAVAGVREILIPGEKPQNQPISMSFYGSPTPTEDEPIKKRLESAKFQEIPVRVELQIRFATTPAPGNNQKAGQ